MSATAKLLRGGRVVAQKTIDGLRGGHTKTLAVRIADKVGGGPATLKPVLRDKTGNTKTVHRRLRVPG